MTGEVLASGSRAALDLEGATVVVRVEESSRADAPATVASERVLEDCWRRGDRAPFSLAVAAVDPGATYTVTASVDLDGDGEIGRGDYLSVESYPVITRGHGTHAVVAVRRLG